MKDELTIPLNWEKGCVLMAILEYGKDLFMSNAGRCPWCGGVCGGSWLWDSDKVGWNESIGCSDCGEMAEWGFIPYKEGIEV